MSQEYQKLPYILIWVLSLDFYDKNDRIRIENSNHYFHKEKRKNLKFLKKCLQNKIDMLK